MEEAMERHKQDLQDGYDKVAVDYAEALYRELDAKPLDRALLDRFIAGIKGRGPVCDMGCGPGQIGRYLYDHGLSAPENPILGVDLAHEMVREAQRLNPMITYRQGDMLALDAPDDAWAGIVAFYSIIHIPPPQVVGALRELKRVLRPGGLLLLSIHVNVGEDVVHLQEFFGKPVSMDFFFFKAEEMEDYLRQAGFEHIELIQRQPYPDVEYQGPRAYFFARKPEESPLTS
jgi:SAM-dependent methyltransferase